VALAALGTTQLNTSRYADSPSPAQDPRGGTIPGESGWSAHRERCGIEFVDPMPEAMSGAPRESCSSSHGPESLDDPASLPCWLRPRQRPFADEQSMRTGRNGLGRWPERMGLARCGRFFQRFTSDRMIAVRLVRNACVRLRWARSRRGMLVEAVAVSIFEPELEAQYGRMVDSQDPQVASARSCARAFARHL
jgi:hypothetical protein